MAKHGSGRRALADLALLQRVVEHKRIYFYSSWASYDTAKPGNFRLVPPDHRLPDLKTDYVQMQEMFTEKPPGFDDLLGQLKAIEDKINLSERE
jgi:hypothetical protein